MCCHFYFPTYLPCYIFCYDNKFCRVLYFLFPDSSIHEAEILLRNQKFIRRTDMIFFFLSFKISCNYNNGKAMLNDLIVLEVIAHIFPMHKKMKHLLRKGIKIFLILQKEMMEFALYLSMCHWRIICISFNLLMSGIRLQSR